MPSLFKTLLSAHIFYPSNLTPKVLADVEEARMDDDQSENYPIAEAVPIVNPIEDAADRPPSVNPQYHYQDVPTTASSSGGHPQSNNNDIQPLVACQGREPTTILCPYCRTEGVTRTKNYVGSSMAAVLAILLCCFGWCCCLCCLPFCCRPCQETDHYCTRCNQKVSQVHAFSNLFTTTQQHNNNSTAPSQ